LSTKSSDPGGPDGSSRLADRVASFRRKYGVF
jgi:hypothetical protein